MHLNVQREVEMNEELPMKFTRVSNTLDDVDYNFGVLFWRGIALDQMGLYCRER